MAGRKLQGEIDRVLKKVEDGVQVFEQIWDKVYSAATTAQKEKYEGDLKKEIKKLQRLRDQIKTWQGDSSIKDKSKLDANRKLIEEKMEKFKVCEKETKTKAFSKEGLAQDRTDPKQKAKDNVNDWVGNSIARLTEQKEEMEAEIETLNSGKRKKRNDENPRVVQLKEHIERHNYHVEMLERVLRAVDNDAVTPEEAEELKDSVDYYIDSNQDPDFFEDDEMYDQLNLETVPTTVTHGTKKGGKGPDRDEEEDASIAPPPPSTPSKKAPSSPRNAKSGKLNSSSVSSAKVIANQTSTRNPSPKARRGGGANSQSTNPASSNGSNTDQGVTQVSPRSPRKAATGVPPTREASASPRASVPLLSNVVRASTNKANARTVGVSQTVTPTSVQNAKRAQPVKGTAEAMSGVANHAGANTTSNGTRSVREGGQMFPPPAEPEPTSSAPIEHVSAPPITAPASAPISSPTVLPKPATSIDLETVAVGPSADENNADESLIDEVLAFMPDTPMTKDNVANYQKKAPIGGNGQNVSPSSPRNPIDVPSSFPAVPAPVFDSREVFQQFDPDTLFFIFYYQQGTYQQFLAASELKRQGWRFHKKYLTWFQRHDEPKISTDEYETGTFIYFDYANVVVRGHGSGWCQRIKSEFRFEYRFLEDELV